jgi:hypothetical protein
LQIRILGVQNAQRIGVQPALRIVVELPREPLEIGDQARAMQTTLFGIADRIDREPRAVGDAQRAPQPRQHHDMLRVDFRAGEAQRLDVELMELPVPPLLRALVAKHRADGPHALRPLVGERMLDGGTHDTGGGFRTQRQALAVELVLERVHLVLDDVRRVADAANEHGRRFDDRHSHVPVPVLGEDAARRVLESLPKRRIVRQDVVHATDRLERRSHVR